MSSLDHEEFPDDLPPLEDMTEKLNNLKLQKSMPRKTISTYLEPTKDESKAKEESIMKLLNKESKDITTAQKKKKKNNDESDRTFCGFKKGFLVAEDDKMSTSKNKDNKKKTNSSNETDFDIVKKTDNDGTNATQVISEIQEAVKSQIPLLQSSDWVTEDLLSKIMTHPKLSKKFLDPRFSEAIAKFQKNPREVMSMCAADQELREFIQEFCAIMGEYFTNLADKQSPMLQQNNINKSNQKSTKQQQQRQKLPQQSNQDDEQKIQQILSDPELSEILKSPEIQELLHMLKTNPSKGQSIMKTADSGLRLKIHKLIEAGLLQMV